MDPSCENFTHALLASFGAFTDQGASIVRWVTSSEAGTVGFYLYREVNGEWEAVHEGLLPGLLDAPQGGVYDFRDVGASPNEDEQYLLVEVDVRGVQSEHGPFVVNFDSAGETLLDRDVGYGAGRVYELRDGGADASRSAQYLLVEVDVRGVQSEYGPFEVSFDSAGETLLDRDAGYTRQAHQLAPLGTTLKASSTEKQSGGDPVAIYLGVEETGLYAVSAAEIAARFGITEASVQDRIQTGELLLTEEGETVAWTPSADGSGTRSSSGSSVKASSPPSKSTGSRWQPAAP